MTAIKIISYQLRLFNSHERFAKFFKNSEYWKFIHMFNYNISFTYRFIFKKNYNCFILFLYVPSKRNTIELSCTEPKPLALNKFRVPSSFLLHQNKVQFLQHKPWQWQCHFARSFLGIDETTVH